MSNEIVIAEVLQQLNRSLCNLESALTVIEYSAKNDMPISNLAKMTVDESCEDIQNVAKMIAASFGGE